MAVLLLAQSAQAGIAGKQEGTVRFFGGADRGFASDTTSLAWGIGVDMRGG